MSTFEILLPLAVGLGALLTPVRRKTPDESDEKLARRKKFMRQGGVGMLVVAGAFLIMKLMPPQ